MDNIPHPRFFCVSTDGKYDSHVSLSLFLAHSESMGDFVLNAMAMIFFVTLDNIPLHSRNVYTFDPEANGPEIAALVQP